MAMATDSSAKKYADFKAKNILMTKNSNVAGQERPDEPNVYDLGFQLIQHEIYKIGDGYKNVRRKDAFLLYKMGVCIPDPDQKQIAAAEKALKVKEENKKAAMAKDSVIAEAVKAAVEAVFAKQAAVSKK